jgi:dihydrofolate reductase
MVSWAPELAAQPVAGGLVHECHLSVAPLVVGRGERLFQVGSRLDLELVDHRGFVDGFVALRYAARG